MVFKNLPIEFDVYGRAHLRDEEAESPFDFTADARIHRLLNRERAIEKLSANLSVRNLDIEPVTRTGGQIALHAVVDFDQRRVLDANVEYGRFYGYEMILNDREPSDAIHISSRANGSSSGAHAISAAIALEMAAGVPPPPLAIIARNLGSCGELISECINHLFVLAGPDYSESAVSRTSLSLWGKAQRTAAAGIDTHGLETIADVMRGMNPMRGHLYLESLQMARLGREIAALMFGKHPHPTTIVPAGIGIEAHKESFNQVLGRINALLDYVKKLVVVWDDLVDFLYDAEPRFRRVGELPGNLMSVGIWDDPEVYDASYTNCNEWGSSRMMAPGVIAGGELRTERLTDINIGIEEFVDRSYFRQWEVQEEAADPLSGPLSPWHPWNKETLPFPAIRNWKEKYSWNTAPRWDREVMESGPLARLWINAVMGAGNCDFIQSYGSHGSHGSHGSRKGLEISLPRGQQPAATLLWLVPERPNALERNRARAYQVAYAAMVAYADLLKAFDHLRRGETEMSVRFLSPEKKISAGFWECSRGVVTHHLVVRGHKIANYQVITPTEWMGSPRDAIGLPGIYETAVINTPLLEECARFEDCTGIDILRAVRSFDP